MRVLCQNCFCPVLGGGRNPEQRLDRLVGVARNYDVLLLQEVFHLCFWGLRFFGQSDLLKRRLREIGYEHFVMDDAPMWGQDSGLFMASRKPFTQVVFRPYVAWSGLEVWTHKGILSAQTHGVMFVNTHLQANHDGARAKQLKELRVFLGDEDDVVVGGDLNTDTLNIRERQQLFETLPDLSVGETSGYDVLRYYGGQKLDHVMVWRASFLRLAQCRILDLNLSDHPAIECVVECAI